MQFCFCRSGGSPAAASGGETRRIDKDEESCRSVLSQLHQALFAERNAFYFNVISSSLSSVIPFQFFAIFNTATALAKQLLPSAFSLASCMTCVPY